MSTKEAQEKIVSNMTKWKKIENASVSSTGKIIEKTENPIVRLVMEIIQRDSQMHFRVQDLIADSLTTKAVSLSPDEVGDVWSLIEKHIELEKSTIQLAKDSLRAIEGKKGMTVQAYLLEYLLKDEEKHDAILEKLETIKKNMYPYG
jgi:rubrerythrin